MDKQQAVQEITNLFTNRFDPEKYKTFLQNLLNEIEPGSRGGKQYSGNLVPDAYREHVNQYWCLGKYVDPDGVEVDLQIVEVKSFSKLERARSALRNFAVNRLRQFDKEVGLFAYYAKDDNGINWRFSFVKIEHEADMDESGKVKLNQVLTPAKRYSFLVGVDENSHTAAKQLLPLLEMDYANPTVEEIEASFSIEKVTKEFFDQYKLLFQKLAQHLKQQDYFKNIKEEEEIDKVVSRFAKKLLGQIVFLYFLQKKGWLGVPKQGKWGAGQKHFMRERFELVNDSDQNYYHDFLQYLFYEALANERKKQKDPSFYKRFDTRIPFLNGGLFEADYDWQNEIIDLPNSLFHNDEKNQSSGDIGTGILDVFDRYNFTIKEDEPLEKEVAVDPEMLGKVFENMLEVTERKNKGAFYTPREIVHYMCQESIIHYLDNTLNTYSNKVIEQSEQQSDMFGARTNQLEIGHVENILVPKQDIELLIRKGHLALENDIVAINAQEKIKSGKQKTTKHESLIPESVISHSIEIDNALATIKVCDPAIGSGAFPVGLLHEIVNARVVIAPYSGNKQTLYELKFHTIGESIYGVDIDASAIDVARLRLWLSLIVDEEDYGNIDALPNLDYKIVQGNALSSITIDLFSKDILTEIESKKHAFFKAFSHKEKAELLETIGKLFLQLTQDNNVFDFELYFSEVWHQKDGFDIVIENPPYISHDNIDTSTKILVKNYESFEPFADIFCYLLEKSINILNPKGILTAITSNSYLRSNYGKPLRNFISKNVEIINLLNIVDSQLFKEATVNTAIIVANKLRIGNKTIATSGSMENQTDILAYIKKSKFELNQTAFKKKVWQLIPENLLQILTIIEGDHPTLEKLKTKIRLGIATGSNDVFVIDRSKKENFLHEDINNAEIIRPVLRGRDITRYGYEDNENYIILAKNGINVADQYPTIYKYLDSFGNKFKNRGAKGNHWSNLRACSFYDDFKQPKIVWIELSDIGRFTYIEDEVYLLNSAYFLIPPPQTKPGYLLAVLNSSLMRFYLANTAETSGVGTSRWINNYVKEFPIKLAQKEIQSTIELISNYCLYTNNTKSLLIFNYFDLLLDGLVSELYFADEFKISNKEIIRHLGKPKELLPGMSHEEKNALIKQEFDRLYDPRHPVRNIVETLDSVEVVRNIRDSLEKK